MALDHDALVLRPDRRLLFGVTVEHVPEKLLETLIGFKLVLDLAQECFGDGFRMGKDTDGNLGIIEDILDG